MALNIKRNETERIVRRLAQQTGESVTMAVERAAAERLARLERPDKAERLARMLAFLDKLPPLEPGPSHDEIMAEIYDENGSPR